MSDNCKVCGAPIKNFPYAGLFRSAGWCRDHIPANVLESLAIPDKVKRKNRKRKLLNQCTAITKRGDRCRNMVRLPDTLCGVHATKDKKVNYKKYINSKQWTKKSKSVRAIYGDRCRLCNRAGIIHSHHRTYERLGDEVPDDLTPLCPDCHDLFGYYFLKQIRNIHE